MMPGDSHVPVSSMLCNPYAIRKSIVTKSAEMSHGSDHDIDYRVMQDDLTATVGYSSHGRVSELLLVPRLANGK